MIGTLKGSTVFLSGGGGEGVGECIGGNYCKPTYAECAWLVFLGS